MSNNIVGLDSDSLKSAYFYLLGRVLAIKQEHIDIKETPYNQIKYNPLGAASADFVNPNMDVAYLEAWIAVDEKHAIVMNVPKIENRYYTVQIMDGWGEVIANVNERNYPEHPYGKVAFVKTGSSPKVPDDALVIELPSEKAKILARVELADSPDEAVRLQKAFSIEASSEIQITAAPMVPNFQAPELPGAAIFKNATEILNSCPDQMPDAPQLQAAVNAVAEYMVKDKATEAQIQETITKELVPYFYNTILGNRPIKNGWNITDFGGRFGNDYQMRTLVNFGGIWANVAQEAVYYTTHKDQNGDKLIGDNTYSLHFPKDELPATEVHAFWSLTMLQLPGYRVIPNQLNRFSINNISDLQYNEDGSLTLYFGPELPEGVNEANWLPTIKGVDITLTQRLYVPKASVLNHEWSMPAVQNMNK